MKNFNAILIWIVCCLTAEGVDLRPLTSQQFLRAGKSGDWHLWAQAIVLTTETREMTVTRKVPETATVTQEVDGKIEEKAVTTYREVAEKHQYTVCIPIQQPVARFVHSSALRAREIDGRVIAIGDLRRRVGDGTVVVVYGTSGPLPESYKELFKSGTIVVTVEEDAKEQEAPFASADSELWSAELEKLPAFRGKLAPQFAMLSQNGVNNFVVRRTAESSGSIEASRPGGEDGNAAAGTVPVLRTVRQSETFVIAVQDLRFHTVQNKAVSTEQIRARNTRETAVVYNGGEEAIDPFWQQNLKPTAIIVTGPQLPFTREAAAPTVAPVAAPGPVSSPPTTPAAPIPETPVPQPAPSATRNESESVTPLNSDSASPESKPLPTAGFDLSAVEQDVVRRVNLARKEAKLAPLRCEAQFSLAACRHAEQMAKTRTLTHDLNGRGVGDRLETAGIQWIRCGENIACGQTTPSEAFDSWMKSPGHRANIMTAEYSRIGVAVAEDSSGQKYWTMVLAHLQ